MKLSEVVETSRRVGETSKRLAKIDALASLLRRLQPDEVAIAVAFLSGWIRQGRIGIGYATIRDAGAAPAAEATLELGLVDRAFDELAQVEGPGSEARRAALLGELLGRATEGEQSFLKRLLLGELRQGALEGIMADAVAKASGVPADRVRRAAMIAGDITVVARSLIEKGASGLEQYSVRLFRPVQPMLAQTAEDITKAMEELEEAALEWKLDGARVQVHKSGSDVVVFSRSMKDVTAAAPEIVEAVRSVPAHDAIFDGEAISLQGDGRPQPFQITMRRFGRKLQVDALREELPLSPFFFDLMYADGAALLDEPQSRRFEELRRIAPAQSVIPHTRASSGAQAEAFVEDALARGHEGVMAKAPDSPYAAGARGQSWLKVKQPRTLDLVILAAEWGNGRRQGWLSNLHLGARDTEKGGFAMLGKTFKGLTDEMLAWQTQELLKIEIERDGHTVYVEPKLVAEIAFNEIQVSARYVSGLALRFARVKRYRPDKSAAESDTFQTVQRMAGMPAARRV